MELKVRENSAAEAASENRSTGLFEGAHGPSVGGEVRYK